MNASKTCYTVGHSTYEETDDLVLLQQQTRKDTLNLLLSGARPSWQVSECRTASVLDSALDRNASEKSETANDTITSRRATTRKDALSSIIENQ